MVKLNRIGVIKAALFLGMFGVFIGLIFGIMMFITVIIFSTATSNIAGLGSGGIISELGASSWYIFLLVFPIGYGIINFLVGLIFTPLANLVLKIIKGLDLEMVE